MRCAALAAFFALLLQGQNPDPRELLARAVRLHQSGQFEAAVRDYREFLKILPSQVEVRSNLGAALASLGRYAEAITEYRQALETAPRNTGIRLNLALAYFKASQTTEAIRELELVHKEQPDALKPALLLADCYLRAGENGKVIQLLSPLEAAHKQDKAFAYLLGTALIRDNQVQKGQVLVDQILRDGQSAEAHFLLGTVQLMAHDYNTALKELGRAAELNPKLPSVHAFHGRALLQTGDTRGAMEAFRKELSSDPNDFDSNLNLGFLLKQDQKFADAQPYLERALRVRPGAAAARYQLATLYLATGKTDEALQALEQVVRDSPEFVEAHVSLATVYYRLKRKADGDREREIVRKLNAARQAAQPGVRETAQPASR